MVVDVDLEKFFDRVNHDILMERLSKRIDDKAVLRLIRRYLVAGIMDGGVVMQRYEGTPQGGPLSPLLANVLLDEVDRALETRGIVSCAMPTTAMSMCAVAGGRAGDGAAAEDVRQAAPDGQRDQKCGGECVFGRKFLGYSFWVAPKGEVKCRVATSRWRPSSSGSGN
jgi:RNA-directed DNA polymerase